MVASTVVGTAAAHSLGDNYGTVVDIVDAGADSDGGTSITPILRRTAADDTLLKFPPGRYYMDEQFRFTGFENFGLLGNDATLVPANYHEFDGPQYRLFRLGVGDSPGRSLRFEGFTVDQTAPDTGIRVINAEVEDGLVVRDIVVRGRHDSGTWGPGLFNITDPDGSGVVERFTARGGAAWVDETPNAGNLWRGPSGIIANRNHEGTLRFRNCALGAFPDNGLYASGGTGTVVVEGGRYQNSGTASIRLGGRRVVVDGATARVGWNPENYARQDPIRLDYAGWATLKNVTVDVPRPNGIGIAVRNGVDGVTIRNASISMARTPTTGVGISPQVGPSYLEDVEVEMDASGNAIEIRGDSPGEVGLQNVRITGDASGSPLRHAIYCSRDHCQFRGVDIDQTGGEKRRGLELNGRDYLLYDCDFGTTHHPVVVNGDNVWVEDCRFDSYAGYASLKLNDGAGSIRLKNSSFPDGVADLR